LTLRSMLLSKSKRTSRKSSRHGPRGRHCACPVPLPPDTRPQEHRPMTTTTQPTTTEQGAQEDKALPIDAAYKLAGMIADGLCLAAKHPEIRNEILDILESFVSIAYAQERIHPDQYIRLDGRLQLARVPAPVPTS